MFDVLFADLNDFTGTLKISNEVNEQISRKQKKTGEADFTESGKWRGLGKAKLAQRNSSDSVWRIQKGLDSAGKIIGQFMVLPFIGINDHHGLLVELKVDQTKRFPCSSWPVQSSSVKVKF